MNTESARQDLLEAEHQLMRERERVAEMRRNLPAQAAHEDYIFQSASGPVRLSELVTADRPLVLYHFMFGGAHANPCPMCSMWADGWNGVAHHLAERFDFVLVAAGPWDATAKLVEDRGWTNLRWIATGDNSFKTDVGGQDENGNQWPHISVWQSGADGPEMTYDGSASLLDGHGRGLDLLSPVWHLQDLLPNGRGDWMPGGM